MKGIFFLIFIPFLALSQNNDVLKIRGTKPIELLNSDELFFPGKYDGKLLEYSTDDISNNIQGGILFYLKKSNDTIRISSNQSYKLKLNYSSPKYFKVLNKKSWNQFELGLNFGDYMAYGNVYLAKGINNKKVLNSGIGTGILTIDRINFIPIFINSSYDIFPSNSLEVSRYKFFTYNNIGYSFAEDFRNDYISVEGGLYWSIGLGIKKSLRRTNISLKGGYLLQKYKSEHNLWWWDMIFFDPNQNVSDNITRREGYYNRFILSFSVTF